jgi:hypothetical protein
MLIAHPYSKKVHQLKRMRHFRKESMLVTCKSLTAMKSNYASMSGTGACAAVVSGIRRGLLDSPVKVHTRGGDLLIAWGGMINQVAQPVIMTGPAITVFEGETRI